MRYCFIVLILLNLIGCTLKPSADSALENLGHQNSEDLTEKKELSDLRHRFKVEINKSDAKIQSIYKEQLQLHSFPDVECIGFQFQMTKEGVLKSVEADKVSITVENTEMIIKLIDLFKKIEFPSASYNYSTSYKFCFNK